jgi:hypothetical protein
MILVTGATYDVTGPEALTLRFRSMAGGPRVARPCGFGFRKGGSSPSVPHPRF